MADQSDVETALAAIVANALYPAGSSAPSATGTVCRIYRGFPAPAALDADLAAGTINVSITARDGAVKNVTRYPRRWITIKPVSAQLNVALQATMATFLGNCAVGQLAGVIADDMLFPYAVQANDSPATVASNLATMLREAGWLTNYSGTTLSVPAATRFVARVVSGAGALQEIKRQEQGFSVTLWCPDPGTRDLVAPLIDDALSMLNFVALADGSSGRLIFVGSTSQDGGAEAHLYRRELTYSVEYPTTISQFTPAMLFGTEALRVNAEFVEQLQS
jgi:hypothetical protein